MAQKLAKATVTPLDGRGAGDEIAVLFNPSEYNVEYSASFSETAAPGLSNPILQFVNGNAQVLSMDLFFDTWTNGGGSNVIDATKPLTDLLSIDGTLHAPPRVKFHWGVFQFVAVVERITQRFTMFRSDGTPVRATLTVAFKQYRPIAEQLQEPRRNSADKTKRRVLESHDSIWLLAAREYGDPRFWRVVARANDIEDPRRIEPGQVLVLPPLDEERRREVDGATGAA
ncbi:peptigoglycan-binding protein LysM [Streptomyces sp. NPDC057302]|uniref:CIS tube protein n=1 Tax=Streptomyces sp. NPDC057302 TaxID=3346094 RepID=UPI00362D5056